jgi:hypothetical protein
LCGTIYCNVRWGMERGVVEAMNEYGTNEKKVPCIIIIRQGRVPYVWVGQSM